MLTALVASILLLTALDHWTTYLCLHHPVEGWLVSEGNPVAAWMFDVIGLVPGLALDTLVTLGAVAFLVKTDLLPRPVKAACLALLMLTTAFAVTNNFDALAALDVSPLGRG